MKKKFAIGLTAMMLLTAGQCVLADDISVVAVDHIMESVYPESLLQLMYGTMDYETAKQPPYHYVGNVLVNLEVAGIDQGIIIYKLEDGQTQYSRIADGTCMVSIPANAAGEDADNGKEKPEYKASVCGVLSLKSQEEAGVSIELGEPSIRQGELEESYTEIDTTVKEADNKPVWMFYTRNSNGEYGSYVRDELFYEGSNVIYDGAFGEEKPEDISYNIEGVIAIQPFDGKYEISKEDAVKKMDYGYEYEVQPVTITFEEPLNGMLIINEKAGGSAGYCKTVPISNETSVTFEGSSYMADNAAYSVIGYAPVEQEMALEFEGAQEKTWEEYFVEWQEGTPEEVFDKYAEYYTQIRRDDADEDETARAEATGEGQAIEDQDSEGQETADTTVYTDEETIKKVQEALNAAGYDCGTPDGMVGSNTYAGMNAYQEAKGLTVTNDITGELLKSLGIS